MGLDCMICTNKIGKRLVGRTLRSFCVFIPPKSTNQPAVHYFAKYRLHPRSYHPVTPPIHFSLTPISPQHRRVRMRGRRNRGPRAVTPQRLQLSSSYSPEDCSRRWYSPTALAPPWSSAAPRYVYVAAPNLKRLAGRFREMGGQGSAEDVGDQE
jgi:hypothetical protein